MEVVKESEVNGGGQLKPGGVNENCQRGSRFHRKEDRLSDQSAAALMRGTLSGNAPLNRGTELCAGPVRSFAWPRQRTGAKM